MKRAIAFLSILVVAAGLAWSKSERVTIMSEGVALDAVIQTPKIKKGQKIPMVILCHGLTASKEHPIIEGLANRLEKIGIASLRFDFNGHGKSGGDFSAMTVGKELIDAQNVFDYVKSLSYVDETKIAMAGHSQGGVVTSMFAGTHGNEIRAIVLFAPAAVLHDYALQGNWAGLATFDPENLPEKFGLGRFQLGREYLKEAQSLDIYKTASGYAGKVCLLQGKSDEAVPFSYALRFNETWLNNSDVHLLQGETHDFTEHLEKALDIATAFFAENVK